MCSPWLPYNKLSLGLGLGIPLLDLVCVGWWLDTVVIGVGMEGVGSVLWEDKASKHAAGIRDFVDYGRVEVEELSTVEAEERIGDWGNELGVGTELWEWEV